MAPYHYRPLDKEKEEIRVIDILPSADFNAPIELVILHAQFIPPPDDVLNDHRTPLSEIIKTLPPGWTVDETLEGRFLYHDRNNDGSSTWQHPTGLDFGDPPACPPISFEPAYEALSYVWGESHNPEVAYMIQNREIGHYTFQLGRNLAEAFRHLRHPSTPRRMWVDAVCINQQDLNERADQILRMRDIYRLAVRVVVWLGPADETSDLAMKSLERLGERLEASRQWSLPSPNPSHSYEWRHPTCDIPFSEEMWESVYCLLKRPWFDRVWTIQEVQLANRDSFLQCGNTTLCWYRFRTTTERFYLANLRKEWTERLLAVAHSAVDLSALSFGTLLLITTGRLCSDQRDKVYGILGLLPRRLTSYIQPDYTQSIFDVYKNTLLQHTAAGGSLGLLDYCDIATTMPDIPSWAPNWQLQLLNYSPNFARWVYQSSICSSSMWTYTAPDILEVAAVRQSHVTAVSPILRDVNAMLDFIREAYSGNVPRVSGGEHLKDYVYLSNLGCIDELRPGVDYTPWDVATRTLLDFINNEPNADPPRPNPFLLVTTVQMRMVFASGGWVGLGPSSAECGDLLVAIPGCRLPKLLRPVPGSLHHQIIGSCQIYGMMNAEALLGPVPDPYSAIIDVDKTCHPQTWFLHQSTGERLGSVNDPRLERLPAEWVTRELSGRGDESNDGFLLFEFANIKTGEVRRTDPRMTPEALKARGVALETFSLV